MKLICHLYLSGYLIKCLAPGVISAGRQTASEPVGNGATPVSSWERKKEAKGTLEAQDKLYHHFNYLLASNLVSLENVIGRTEKNLSNVQYFWLSQGLWEEITKAFIKIQAFITHFYLYVAFLPRALGTLQSHYNSTSIYLYKCVTKVRKEQV